MKKAAFLRLRRHLMPGFIQLQLLKTRLSFKPKYAPTDIVKNLKGYTARAFFKKHPEIKHQKLLGGHLWSNSYYMSTLGNMSKDVVERYIQNQYMRAENEGGNSSRG